MALDPRSPEFERAARAAISAHEASEIVRQYQQGYGKPIISTEMGEHRVVAVGKTVKWSKNWRFFTDFLVDHLKDKIGRPWAIQAQREGKAHPIFDWLTTMGEIASSLRQPGRVVFESSCQGHLGAIWRLGYALYLIEHNDQLDDKLIRRLRSGRSFHSAYYEAQIAAAFAVSGFKLSMAEIRRSSFPTPEFWATSRSGTRYAVEAKRKSEWKSDTTSINDGFKAELRQWIRNQIYSCSMKRLVNPIYCLELSIKSGFSEEEWTEISKCVNESLKEADNIRIKGEDPSAAYVFVTNDADVLEPSPPGISRIAQLTAFNMANWHNAGETIEFEAAFDAQDAHREVVSVFKTFEDVDVIPQSFDGQPIILDEIGNRLEIGVRIGSRIAYPGPDGTDMEGLVYEVCSMGDTLMVCVESDGSHHMVKVPLLQHEIEAQKKYGDAVFGKPEERKSNLNGDPLEFYEWITGVYENYDRRALLIQVGNHPSKSQFEKLPLEELRIRAAREVTKAAVQSSGRPGQV